MGFILRRVLIWLRKSISCSMLIDYIAKHIGILNGYNENMLAFKILKKRALSKKN